MSEASLSVIGLAPLFQAEDTAAQDPATDDVSTACRRHGFFFPERAKVQAPACQSFSQATVS